MPAIVLSSHTIGLGVIRSLGIMGVPVYVFYYDKKDMGYVSKYVIESTYCPHPEHEENNFINLLLEYGKKLQGALLVPVDDATISAVSKNKSILEKYFKVACPDWEISRKYINKKNTYELAQKIGIPCPKTIIPTSLDDARKYFKLVEFPCVIKPCESHKYYEIFEKKMIIVNSWSEMKEAYQEAADVGLKVMIQEYIPGGDSNGVNYNSYMVEGKPVAEFTAEKVRYAPPGIGVPRVVVSKSVPEVVESGRKILNAMNYYGYSCTEFKKDPRDEIFKLMEINGRHNRSTLLATRCGINFPWVEYALFFNKDIALNPSYKKGVYWIDELRDIIYSIRYLQEERYSLKQYIHPYVNPHIFAVLDLKDIKPFLKRMCDLTKMAVNFAIRPLRIKE